VKILFQALQIIATYPSLNLNFPASLSNTLNIISITNLNIEIFSPECSSPISFWGKYNLKQALPIISTAAVLLVTILGRALKKAQFNLVSLMHLLLTIGCSVYLSLYSLIMSSWVDAFNCQKQEAGVYILVKNPSLKCFDDLWKAHLASIVIFGLLNLIIVPGFLLSVVLKIRPTIDTPETQKKYAFLVSQYQARYYYWELVAVLKRVLLFCSLGLFNQSAVKYFLAVAIQFVFVFLDVMVEPYKVEEQNELSIV
jgi:hypothetical protein